MKIGDTKRAIQKVKGLQVAEDHSTVLDPGHFGGHLALIFSLGISRSYSEPSGVIWNFRHYAKPTKEELESMEASPKEGVKSQHSWLCRLFCRSALPVAKVVV